MKTPKSPETQRQEPRGDLATAKTPIAPQAARIAELAAILRGQKTKIRADLISAAEIGHQLGRELNAARTDCDQQTFVLILEQAELSKDEAGRWMQLELSFALPPTADSPLALRCATFALGIIPDKPAQEHAGNMQISIPYVRTGELALVFGRIKRQLELQRATLDLESAKADTVDLFEFLKTIHEPAK